MQKSIETLEEYLNKLKEYTRKISRIENMEYDEEKDTCTCRNGKVLPTGRVKREKTKTGFERETTVYSCQDCEGCPNKKKCIKGNHSKKPMKERTCFKSKKCRRGPSHQ